MKYKFNPLDALHIYIGLSAVVLSALVLSTPSDPLLLSPPTKRVASPDDPSGDKEGGVTVPTFLDQTLSAGLTFSHLQGDEHLSGIDETLGPGACVIDYDNDGWMDIFLVNGSGQTRYYRKQYWWQQHRGHALYRNLGNGVFTEVTDSSGLSKPSWGMGCASGDFDNDGNKDLLITNLGQNRLYRNLGNGRFEDVTANSGLMDTAWSTSAALADYDGDGLLDIYVANYINYVKGAKTYETQSQYEGDTPVTFNSLLYDAEPNKLYRNTGNFTFTDVSDTTGVADKDGRSLDALWIYANKDNLPDLFITNDGGGGSNTLFINQGSGRFMEQNTDANLSSASGHRGIAGGDMDNDGDIDLVVSGNQSQSLLVLINAPMKQEASNRTFSDKANELGISQLHFAGYSGWGLGLRDFNNDGWLDLFAANGLSTPDPDTDKISQGQNKQLWLNKGQSRFEEVTWKAGPALLDTQSARGTVFADFDNDGDIDIYIAHNNDLGQLLTNQLSNNKHWLGLQLIGTENNWDAVGARVWLETAGQTQYRELSIGSSFLSGNDQRLHFGLPVTSKKDESPKDASKKITLTVEWPNGDKAVYTNLPHNQYLTIKQGTSTAQAYKQRELTTQTTPRLSLSVGVEDTQSRNDFLQWLTRYGSKSEALSNLEAALKSPQNSTRITATKLLGEQQSGEGLSLLVEALSDNDENVRQTAVNSLCRYEAEISIRWLLRMLEDPAPAVRSETADCFAFFFREEEAVVYRKYLAIPYLIKLLEDNETAVQISAIRALADAERFRAVSPLINLLNNHKEEVKLEAVRALGLIREQHAIEPLLTVFNSREASSSIKAITLISLARLGDKDVSGKIMSLLNSHQPELVMSGLETIDAILKNREDGIVLNPRSLIDLLDNWYQPAANAMRQNSKADATSVDNTIAKIVSRTNHPIPESILADLLKSDSEQIRTNAFKSAIRNNLSQRQEIILKGLADSSRLVRNAVLTSASTANTTFPQEQLIDHLKDHFTAGAALQALSRQPFTDAKHSVLQLISNEALNTGLRIKAIQVLAKMPPPLSPLKENLNQHSEGTIRAEALRYWNATHQTQPSRKETPEVILSALEDGDHNVQTALIEILTSRKEAWARHTLADILTNEGGQEEFQRMAIEGISTSNSIYAPVLLLNRAKDRSNPIYLDALRAMGTLDSPIIEHHMWQLLEDEQEQDQVRMIAAKSLVTRHGPKVIKILQDGKADA